MYKNTNLKVNVPDPPPNEPESVTNDSEQVSQHENSDDNTRLTLLLDLPVN